MLEVSCFVGTRIIVKPKTEFEVNFMRLLGKLTNGSTIDVSETGAA